MIFSRSAVPFLKNKIALLCIAGLAACSSTDGGVRSGFPDNSLPETGAKILTPNPQGEVIGNGQVRVALLVPTTIPGGAAAVAKELRNGAAMAMQDFGQGRIQLVVKDTAGQAAVAQTKAAEAITEGSSLILGPLFAANVSAASGSTQPAAIPMLAFSTDTSIARRGVYLFSYTPQADTRRIISYAASNGSRSITAFVPRNAEGFLRERIFREATGRAGVSANIIQYDRTPEGIQKAAVEAVQTVNASDTIYIPEGGPIPPVILGALSGSGVDVGSKKVLGSGTWESVKTSDPLLQNAVYPGRDISSFNGFATRYQSQFGARPGVQAALAYDAVTLASELVRLNGVSDPYARTSLESNRGYKGVNGAFRVRSDGITDRGLAIYKIQGGRGTLVEGAVSSFSGS
ncbi:MAG: penicillin-binding protein activator [Rhizobiaceae bacterium]|nr:penicillin-binding protein activator [Rhizobiaceae bacterium]